MHLASASLHLGYLLTRGANNNGNGNGNGDGGAGNVGLDATGDWSSILSLGEQQRLAFARLLLAAPPVALLDEATSALDAKNEAKMYGLLRNLPDTAYVSVGHRGSLIDFHDDVLRLEAGVRPFPLVYTCAALLSHTLAVSQRLETEDECRRLNY